MKGLDTSAVKMLETLKDYVGCIHLHDVDLLHDNHQLPFNCKIDYAPIIETFKKIGYKGDITLESNSFANFTEELVHLNVWIEFRHNNSLTITIEVT